MGFTCKYCGYSQPHSQFAGSSCSSSPTGKHEIISEKKIYTCKYCGYSQPHSQFAGSSCTKSPTGKHVLMD